MTNCHATSSLHSHWLGTNAPKLGCALDRLSTDYCRNAPLGPRLAILSEYMLFAIFAGHVPSLEVGMF
jgi:hypothetical protein